MLTVEVNKSRNAVEIHADRDGIADLVRKLMALMHKEPGSYVAQGQGTQPKSSAENVLADYYLIFLREPSKENDKV